MRIAATTRSLRVLETSHPPTYYLPADDFEPGALRSTEGSSWCEFKGQATYFDVYGGDAVAPRAAWTYPRPSPGFEAIAGHVAVMPGAMDRCTVDGEVVRAPGGRLLRRLDHRAGRRPVQGRARLLGLVSRPRRTPAANVGENGVRTTVFTHRAGRSWLSRR